MIGRRGEEDAPFRGQVRRRLQPVPGPDLARKLDVLRAHCDAEGRDYDELTKTCYFVFDVERRARRPPRSSTSSAGWLSLVRRRHGPGGNLWQVTPLEVLAAEVIPAVADL